MRITQTQAAQWVGCNVRTVRRFVHDKEVSADEKGRVLLDEVEHRLCGESQAIGKKAGRRPKRLANPLVRYVAVDDAGRLYLVKISILTWDESGKAVPLRGTPCQKGSIALPLPEDQERALRCLELRILAHMMTLAKCCLRCPDWASEQLPISFVQFHTPCFMHDVFSTPSRLTAEGHFAQIQPRPRYGCYVEVTRDSNLQRVGESVVKRGNELGDLLPLAHQLDQILVDVPADRIRVLTALFIGEFLRGKKPLKRRSDATKCQRAEEQEYAGLLERDSEEDRSPLRETKFIRRLRGLIHEGITRHGYTLEWMLGVSRPTAHYWKRKLSPLLDKLKRELNPQTSEALVAEVQPVDGEETALEAALNESEKMWSGLPAIRSTLGQADQLSGAKTGFEYQKAEQFIECALCGRKLKVTQLCPHCSTLPSA